MWHALWVVAVGLSVMLLSPPARWLAEAGSPQRAKDLFYSEQGVPITTERGGAGPTAQRPRTDAPPQLPSGTSKAKVSNNPWMGIAYWVEWERSGAPPTRVADPTRFVFQSGDRIRFHVQTNTEGYLYVLNRGSSGKTTMLFPHAGMAEAHYRVQARQAYTVPPSGWIRFDQQPGEEGVVFLLSPSPLTQVLGNSTVQQALNPTAETRLMAAVDRRRTKDLVVQIDDTHGQEATYAGASLRPIPGSSGEEAIVTVEIRLQHQ